MNDRIKYLLKITTYIATALPVTYQIKNQKCYKHKQLEERRDFLQDAQDPDDVFMYISIKQEVECIT